MRLFKFETLEKVQARAFASTCKIENSKIVRNGHQHTKTTEDEEVFWINAYKKFLQSLGFLSWILTLAMFISPIMD